METDGRLAELCAVLLEIGRGRAQRGRPRQGPWHYFRHKFDPPAATRPSVDKLTGLCALHVKPDNDVPDVWLPSALRLVGAPN